MKTDLDRILSQRLKHQESLTVYDFMTLALYHPQYGYYTNQEVLGKQADYITAPEITPVFGELLAIRCVQFLQSLSFKPQTLALVELGPGRGTLMADMLRVFQKFSNLYREVTLYLLEISPFFRRQQQEKLQGYSVVWVKDLDQIPSADATLWIANEFFDALPIQQEILIQGEWQPRKISVINDQIDFIGPKDAPVRQTCPGYQKVITAINQHLLMCPGLAIIIDYGEGLNAEQQGDTLQALYRHRYADPLIRVGHQDLSHAVDFSALKRWVDPSLKQTLLTQTDFLLSLGLSERIQQMSQKLSTQDALALKMAARRLISVTEMGTLFKVLTLESGF